MKVKNFWKGMILALMVVMLSSLVLAGGGEGNLTGTMVLPLTSGEIKDTMVFKVSVNAAHLQNISNVTFYVDSTQACSNVSVDLEAGLNNTGLTFNCSVDSQTLGLTDASTYTVTAKFYNSTNNELNLVQTTGVVVDNTVPTCDLENVTFVQSGKAYEFPVWVKMDAYNASGCTYTINNKVFTGTVNGTVGAENCHYTLLSKDLPAGVYTINGKTTDSSSTANSTSCTIPYIGFDKGRSAVKGAVIDAELEGRDFEREGRGMTGTSKLLLFGGIGALLYYLFGRKKK